MIQFAEEKAVVSHVDGDFVFIETQKNSTCGSCSSQSGCGNISSVFTLKPRNKLKINNNLELKKGDVVVVAIASDKLLIASILMYLFPLIFLLIFSLIAKILIGETASIIAGLTGLFSGLLLLKKFSQQSEVAKQFEPKLVRKIINVESI